MLWLDGTLHDNRLVPFDLADRGLLLGDGVFDTSLVVGRTMAWRDAHVARLAGACQALDFRLDKARLDAGIDAVLAQTEMGSLRITVTRGPGPRGLAPPKDPKPTMLISVSPPRTEALFAPLGMAVTSVRRNETSPFCNIKTLNYLDAIEVSRAAHARGFDDALFLNARERVACGSVGNVLAFFGDQLVTPPVSDGIIPGITRAVILDNCPELGLEPVERSMTLADLERADAVVVTSSLRLVAPVSAIGRKQLGSSGSRRVQALIDLVAGLLRTETGVDPRSLAKG